MVASARQKKKPAIQNKRTHTTLTCIRVRAPSNSDVVFLLSQVSHTEQKLVEKQLTSALYKAKNLPISMPSSSTFLALAISTR